MIPSFGMEWPSPKAAKLTVNGKSQVVIQDVTAYQRLVEVGAKPDRQGMVDAIREGLSPDY
jgi:hypothetical protein